MTEDRRGEIALLLMEAVPFFEELDCNIEQIQFLLARVAQEIGTTVEDFESLFRPAYDKFLNAVFPSQKCEVFFRRDLEAKKIAVRFWELEKTNGESPALMYIRLCRFATHAQISTAEMHEWVESFFETKTS